MIFGELNHVHVVFNVTPPLLSGGSTVRFLR